MLKILENKTNANKINKPLLYNQPYTFFKENYNSVIPLDIYQTWYTKDLPQKMRERVDLLKAQNPRFNHHLFDDNDCREFIRTHFKPDVLDAYDRLIPGAYKADLWRLCVLFIHGGIYMDIKFCGVNGFKLIELTEHEHFVKDRVPNAIYNALLASRKGNMFLFKCIRQIVENVKNNYYGNSSLEPTGPLLFKKILQNNYIDNLELSLNIVKSQLYIVHNNKPILEIYDEYRDEQRNNSNKPQYATLWLDRNIYKI